MIIQFSKILDKMDNHFINGCFVDTSILFSATYPLDFYNSQSEQIFEYISKENIPPFTNEEVRTEFLENHRRVLIAECLIDFLEDFSSQLDGHLLEKLKSHRTSYRRKASLDKNNKLDIGQIKLFRKLLGDYKIDENNGWEIFCNEYLNKRLLPIWYGTEEIFDINILTSKKFMDTTPLWAGTMSLVGKYGIASVDAIIVNVFLCSKLQILITADLEMAHVVENESRGSKIIIIPDTSLDF